MSLRRYSARALLLASAMGMAACGSRPPDPRVLEISPSEITQGDAPAVTLRTEAVLPFHVRYADESSAVESQVSVRIGGAPVLMPLLSADGTITGAAPFGLPVGTHDVTVELADGRSGTLSGGFVVKPGVFPDSFTLDPIPDQQRLQPFTVTIRAVGGGAAEFRGVVQFSTTRGNITPQLSGPFTNGVRQETVTLTAPAPDMVISVVDAAGHTGSSNPFRVSN